MSRHAARRHGHGLVTAALICAAALTGAVALPAASAAPNAAASIADAAMDGNTEAVRALLKQGADVNSAQGDGLTALHWAAKKGDAAMASMLIYGGANVRAATRLGGYTPLHMAAEIGSATVIAALIKGGADVNALTTTGTTPLMLAAASGDTGSLAALLDAGADANALETGRGHTALMFAAAADRVDAVKLLLARGADPKLATKTVDLAGLSKAGADPDGRNLAGNPNGRSGGNDRPAGRGERARARRRSPVSPQRTGVRAGRHDAAVVRRPPGAFGRGRRAARRRRQREPAERRRPDQPAADCDDQRPVRYRPPAARARCGSESGEPKMASRRSTPSSTCSGRRRRCIRSLAPI